MGGCATKPKVLKGEEAEVQAPESVKEVPSDTKVVGVVEEAGGDEKKKVEEKGDNQVAGNEVKAIAEGGKAEEREGRPRSLSNLFKDEGGKDSTEAENASSEPEKEEKSKEVEKLTEESELKQPEVEKTVDKIAATEFVDAPGLTVTEKTTEAAAVKETKTAGSPKKKTEEAVREPAEKKTEEATRSSNTK